MRRTLYGPSLHELTPPEIALLQQAGADVDEHPDRDDPMATYVSAFGAIRPLASLRPKPRHASGESHRFAYAR